MSLKNIIPVLLVSSIMGSVYANDNLDKLSEKLIELRGEVELLNSEIHFIKQEHKQEMSFLWTQKTDAKSEQIRNNKLLLRLEKELANKIAENKEKGLSSAFLKPEFMEAISNIENYLASSIPFKQTARQAALLEIKEQVVKNLITVQRGFNKLWAFIEDEIRLTKETGLFQQTIQVSGVTHKQLVAVARLGMMNLYFKTTDGNFGVLAGEPNNWSFNLISTPEQVKQVDILFSSLQKQVRTGLFTLPMMVLGEGE